MTIDDRLDELLMKVDNNIKLDSVILSDDNKELINQFIRETSYRDKLYSYGLEPMNRLLFYGASGCGKTFLAKALSNHLGYKMLYIDIAKSLSDGNVAQNISAIFDVGNKLGNCLIFLDECDSIAWSRDSNSSDGGIIRRATNSLFQHLDQMNTTNIFISATNMLHRLDPAFERRFNLKLEFRRPSMSILEIADKFLYTQFKLIDNANDTTKKVIDNQNRLSFYELEGIVTRAMKRAVLNDTLEIKSSDLYDDVAVAQNMKIRFKTHIEDEDIFQSSIK